MSPGMPSTLLSCTAGLAVGVERPVRRMVEGAVRLAVAVVVAGHGDVAEAAEAAEAALASRYGLVHEPVAGGRPEYREGGFSLPEVVRRHGDVARHAEYRTQWLPPLQEA